MLINPTPLGHTVIGCAIEVHKALGPGLMESPYEHCLAHEFLFRGILFDRQVPVPLVYRETRIDCAYRVDFIVESELLLEIKSVEKLTPVHNAQILTYLKLLKLHQGMLMNFNQKKLVDGLRNFLL
jgi:GxxExxY protein